MKEGERMRSYGERRRKKEGGEKERVMREEMEREGGRGC